MERFLLRKALAFKTKVSERQHLSLFQAFCVEQGLQSLQEITPGHLAAYALSLKGRAVATRESYLCTVKLFFSHLSDAQIILTNPAARLKIPRAGIMPTFPMSRGEVDKLLNAPDCETLLGLRDRAMFETLYATGMRVGELIALKERDVDFAGELVCIQKGKGGKGRWTPLTGDALFLINAYAEKVRPKLLHGRVASPLFLTKMGKPLAPQDVGRLCRRYARETNMTRRVHPHLLRHTIACHLLEEGASLFHVQKLLGHADPATTQRYTAVTLSHIKTVHGRCHPRN